MVTTDPGELRARLAEVEERIDRIGKRMTAGYGSDSDRDGWLLWLRQLTAQREVLRDGLGAGPATGEVHGAQVPADALPGGDVPSGARDA